MALTLGINIKQKTSSEMPFKQNYKVLTNSMIYFILYLYDIFQGRKKT